MNVHNVNAIRTMLEIVEQDGDYLGSTGAGAEVREQACTLFMVVTAPRQTEPLRHGQGRRGAAGQEGARFGGLRSGLARPCATAS